MKSLNQLSLFLFLMFFLACNRIVEPDANFNPSLTMWYDKPAANWTEAIPIGNGSLGAMVFGGTDSETIQFNEETLWTGQPHDYAHEGANNYLDDIRNLLWQGKQAEAEILANKQFMSQPFGQQAYQAFGNVLLNFPGHNNVSKYQRRLNLATGITTTFYKLDGVAYKREIFASHPDKSIIIRLEASKNEVINFSAALDCPHNDFTVFVEGNEILLRGKANNYSKEKGRDGSPYPESKLTFEALIKIINEGGELVKNNNSLQVVNASKVTIYLVAATSFVNYTDISANPAEKCENVLGSLAEKSYKAIKSAHINDYKELFGRVNLDLSSSEISMRPTDRRLISFQNDQDPSLVALLYQYGRYLLIASSRQGSQPANLQGIWNDKLTPPWDSKYTININTEMNYWPAEMTNLSECTAPLIEMVKDLSVSGQNVAKEHYGMNGWVTHHNTDIWRGTAPINNSNHGIWPVGGAWLCQHLYWHYQFTGDKEYLKNTAYPILKEASRFFMEYLVPDTEHPGWLVSGPSNSPEQGGLVMAPTMDHQIIRDLFGNTIEAAGILEEDMDFIQKLKEVRERIAPNQIGKYGQLQEWLEDKDDPGNQHRHISHLWGLHPGNEIHPLTTPALAEACKVTLVQRGDGGTGWSRAWKINFWARLLDGDHSFLLLKNLLVPSITQEKDMKDKGGLYLNLLCAHPPFQIDGNFGATSGISEMLLQSHLQDKNGDFYQDILPALPSVFSKGEISGIKGKGGFEFTIRWQNNQLVELTVKSLLGKKLNLRYDGKEIVSETEPNGVYNYDIKDFVNIPELQQKIAEYGIPLK